MCGRGVSVCVSYVDFASVGNQVVGDLGGAPTNPNWATKSFGYLVVELAEETLPLCSQTHYKNFDEI